jgi:uncharacterized protein YyaL (SSP411 family)
MTNRLADETSPYLLQHADNPVEWYPWGEEALQKAKEEDKPILLSVGYSSCHWCHVMERESFEDEETARIMNENFVSIKVDREERPDIDSLYMSAVQAMTGAGGWPMTVFLTPEGTPFYAGTYFPLEPQHGMPAFKQILQGVLDAYENRREEVLNSAARVHEFLQQATGSSSLPGAESGWEGLLDNAAESLKSQLDTRLGGFGGAPKFPQPVNLEFLLRHYRRTGDRTAFSGVTGTLEAMARGGIYDHLGGGFHRYSVDQHWLVPHFEKMLYDNALLAKLYLEGYQASGEELYGRVAGETLDYLLRDMRSPEGGFYSAEDADSEGEEGKFYVWSPREVREVISPEDSELALRYWDVTEKGNFEGKNILNLPRPPQTVAEEFDLSAEELEGRIEGIRDRLLAAREERVRPLRDEKILAGWNGLVLRALAFASRVLVRADYRRAAEENAEFLLGEMVVDGRLRRSYKNGQARFNGYLEDYAAVADGLVELYEATFERRWLRDARWLADEMLRLFWDGEGELFYDTPADHEQLVARPRDFHDGASPSGNSLAAGVLLRLWLLLDRDDYRSIADSVLQSLAGAMEKMPFGFGRLLCGVDFAVSRPYEIAVVGEPGAGDREALIYTLYERFLPNRVIAGCSPGDGEAAREIPLLEGRQTRDGEATAYVCVNYACQSPTTDPQELARQVGG